MPKRRRQRGGAGFLSSLPGLVWGGITSNEGKRAVTSSLGDVVNGVSAGLQTGDPRAAFVGGITNPLKPIVGNDSAEDFGRRAGLAYDWRVATWDLLSQSQLKARAASATSTSYLLATHA
jgi:hypothetical protein